MTLNQTLLDILACPQCKGPVAAAADQLTLACSSCRLVYPVRDGIPVMLVEEAETLADDAAQPS